MGSIGGEELTEWEKNQACGERILVSVRLRPLNDKEIATNDVLDWECINDRTIIFRNSLMDRSNYPTCYSFDKVFQSHTTTKQVYEEAAKGVALSAVSGINSSIFAYGQTSSGKTYTMTGITEHTVADIFDYIQRHEERAFVLKFSAMEIYNEALRELLSGDGTPLRILDDPERGTIIEKLTEETLNDWSHLQKLLSVCEAQRQIGETLLNETSSRSHQILRLTIESSAREFLGKDNSSTLVASVNFVDLAGSERASQALSAGTRLKEGCHINRSLLTLGTVIRKLSKGRHGHVPYRDSKLTRILQPSLGGNARTAIICTMSPARTHVEQSRNTLLFASCAKEVATNAQVNVVMSDKALVKHLQKELARLECELRTPIPISAMSDTATLLREKDRRIEKMEKEIKELTWQRDIAQSRLQDLLQVVGNNQASKLWAEFDQPPKSESSSVADHLCSDVSDARFKPAAYSSRYTENVSDGGSPSFLTSSSKFVRPDPGQGYKKMRKGAQEDFDDLCRDVRCIEMEASSTNRNIELNAAFPEESEGSVSFNPSENRETAHERIDFRYESPEQELQDVHKTIISPANPVPYSLFSWPSETKSSSSRSLQLTKSRSCRGTLLTSTSSPWFQKNESTPPNGFEKDFLGRPQEFRKKIPALNFGENITRLSGEDSQTCEKNVSVDELKEGAVKITTVAEPKEQDVKIATEEDASSTHTLVKGLKEMTQIEYESQFVDDQVEDRTTKAVAVESAKTVKDVALDPMHDLLDSPLSWLLEFKRQQRQIIDLWDTCKVSLIHRTYFFLLFEGDPTDRIYLEVELRRLSFLKDTFSLRHPDKPAVEDGRTVTLTSSTRALRCERDMLSKQMRKRLSREERESLYQKWGIALDTKQRRLQLCYHLWTDPEDMNHIMESAALVAKLVGLLKPGQALKEMFGLSFTPRRTSRRSYSWQQSLSAIFVNSYT
ncbi:hypothetical protein GIB67_004738 [Kingdonia uniflora]|uniref:Kinesin-like protein n=1 Tax=Kingdonia uniflora TaxID=39325 RepID=A0A7J7NQG9_9MAGN|nr:hypothetical protein GIB67_004738 [Kingdonia uniflora]